VSKNHSLLSLSDSYITGYDRRQQRFDASPNFLDALEMVKQFILDEKENSGFIRFWE
jgi:hypothetical protein